MKELSLPSGYVAPRHEPHCGVLSVAICADIPFEEAFALIKARAGYNGNWKGRTYNRDRIGVLNALDVAHKETHFAPAQVLARSGWPEGWSRRCTLATFAKRFAKPGVTYMASVRGHTFVLRNGMIADQAGVRTVTGDKLARRAIQHTVEILK